MTSFAEVTVRIEFDAGHRVPSHHGKCRNLHGHRYTALVTLRGVVPEDGMVVDFGIAKEVMKEWIDEHYDHGMVLQRGDTLPGAAEPLAELLQACGQKVHEMDEPPTAENMAAQLFSVAEELLPDVTVVKVRLYETPNFYAEVRL